MHNKAYSSITLRFHDRTVEAAFVARQKGTLVRRAKTILILVIITSACGLTVNVVFNKQHQEASFPTHIAYTSNKASLLSFVGMVIGLATFLLALCCDGLVSKLSPPALEAAFATAMILTMVTAVIASPGHIAQIQGYSLQEAFRDKYFSDSRILMMIDAVITAVHVSAPMRWCSLFPLEVTALLLYMAVIWLIGGSEPTEQSVHSLLFLTALTVAAALGKRAAEEGERETFKDIIKEKSLRCEAEFELQRATDAAQSHEERPQRAHAASAGPSTISDSVFNHVYESCSTDKDRAQHLSRIAQMGDAEHWLIKPAEVKVLQNDVLGVGGFALVTRGFFCGMQVAVKRPRHDFDDNTLKDLPNWCNELRVMRHLKHPNLVTTLGAIVDPREHQIAIVLELVEGMTLRDLMARDGFKCVSLLVRFRVMVGVCRALLYMHTRVPHIVHGDLKSSNIMVQVNGEDVHPKLLDFGMSRVITRKTRPLGGTLAWVAPEVLKGRPVKCSSDVYSFGRVVALLATGQSLNDQFDRVSIRRALDEGRSLKPVWPADCPFEPGCKPLVKACLSSNEEQRPRISRVYSALLHLRRDPRLVGPSWQGEFLNQLEAIAAHWDETCQQEGSPERRSSAASLAMQDCSGSSLGVGQRSSVPLDTVEEADAEPRGLEAEADAGPGGSPARCGTEGPDAVPADLFPENPSTPSLSRAPSSLQGQEMSARESL